MNSRDGNNDEPLMRLEADLRAAAQDKDPNSREAAGLAVKAVLEFVYAHPNWTAEGLERPLYALLAALSDLDDGRVVPMLKPTNFDNRPPESSVRQQAKAHACFCIDQLLEIGENVQTACKAVAQVWERAGWPLEARGAPWKTIQGWRDRVSKLAADNPQRVVLQTLRGQTLPQLEKSEILEMLRRTLSHLGK